MMKRRPWPRALACLALLLGFAAACASASQDSSPASPPTEEQVMGYLFAHLGTALPDGQGCSDASPVTVGDYLQTTLVFMAREEEDTSWSRITCEAVPPGPDLVEFYSDADLFPPEIGETLTGMSEAGSLYQCTASWGHAAGEAVWSRGIQFLVDQDAGRALAGSFRCVSTP